MKPALFIFRRSESISASDCKTKWKSRKLYIEQAYRNGRVFDGKRYTKKEVKQNEKGRKKIFGCSKNYPKETGLRC